MKNVLKNYLKLIFAGSLILVSSGGAAGAWEFKAKLTADDGGLNDGAVYTYRFVNDVPFDFDGDGKTDISIYRPSNGQW